MSGFSEEPGERTARSALGLMFATQWISTSCESSDFPSGLPEGLDLPLVWLTQSRKAYRFPNGN